MKKTLTLLLLLLVFVAQAQVSLQKYDLGTTNVGSFAGYNGKTYFFADNNAQGPIWIMNTYPELLIKNQSPDKIAKIDYYPFFCSIGGTLFFRAIDPLFLSSFLCQYDGQNLPKLVQDINTKTSVPSPAFLTELNGKLFLASYKGYGGVLWCYDPAAKTLKKLNTGTIEAASALIAFDNKILFSGLVNGSTGLYSYNPSTDQTTTIADASFFGTDPLPCMFTAYNNKIYFFAKIKGYGDELFEYDDMNQPKRLTNLPNGLPINLLSMPYVVPYNNTRFMAVYKGNLYFTANNTPTANKYGLVRYNIADGTVDNISTPNDTNLPQPNDLIAYAGALYYIDNTSKPSIYRYDGINPPVDIQSVSLPYAFENPWQLYESYGSLYFAAKTPGIPDKYQLFVFTDAAAQNVNDTKTVAEIEIYPNPAASEIHINIIPKQETQLNISITDITGKQVYTSGVKQYSAKSTMVDIPTQNLPAGVYICTITNAGGTKVYSGQVQKQ